MKILIADVLLKGRPNSDWKEGYELCYAFRNLGYECDVAGPNGQISELEIPLIASNYDLIIITENYPKASGWKWWDWGSIDTPKVFWAIDTHLANFFYWILNANINYVAFNNIEDKKTYNLLNSFWLPYGTSKIHHSKKYSIEKTRDVVFVGGMTEDRQRIIDKFGITHISAFGEDYIREMQSSKICFNQSISYDINAKYFEILGSGAFMLTNYNKNFHEFLGYDENVEKMFYYSEDDLGEKINYYLNNNEERELIAKKVHELVLNHHTFENRAQTIINFVKNV